MFLVLNLYSVNSMFEKKETKKVFVVAFGPFLSTRSMEMVYLDLAYNDAPVCVIGTHAGVTSGGGPTHNALIDMNNIRAMPNMILEAPADANQAIKAVDAFLDIGKPMYIRLARGSEPIVYATQDYDYEIGKAVMAKDGTDATIIACGVCVQKAVKAAMELENEGIHVRILDMHTIKPLDKKAVIQAARDTGRIITVEDHGIIGGLGTAVAEVIADNELNCRFKRLGVPDEFSTLGYPEEIYRHYGYNYTGIIRAVKELISIEE